MRVRKTEEPRDKQERCALLYKGQGKSLQELYLNWALNESRKRGRQLSGKICGQKTRGSRSGHMPTQQNRKY